MPKESPSQQIDELKTLLYSYITLGPLVSALFANRIDNIFAACFLFVCLVGAAFFWVKTRLETLEQSVREQEEALTELSQIVERAREGKTGFSHGNEFLGEGPSRKRVSSPRPRPNSC